MRREELLIRRTQVRIEFDRLKYRKTEIDEELDKLAKEIEMLTDRLNAAEIRTGVIPKDLEPKKLTMLLIEG